MSSQSEASDLWPSFLLQNVFILPIILILSYIVYQRYISPLSSIPGPLNASLNRVFLTYHSWIGDMHRTMISLHKKHGSLVRTGPNEVSVSDLSAIKKIYGAGSKFRKSDWYDFLVTRS
jgi:hypothetical protein